MAWFWEVLYVDQDGQIHSMHAARGHPTADKAQLVLVSICDSLDRRIRDAGGRMLDVQIVYSHRKKLYDSDELLN